MSHPVFSSSIPVKIVAGAVVGGLMAAAVVIGCFLCWSRKMARPTETPSQSYITSPYSPDVRQRSMPIDPLADEQPPHTQSDVPAIAFEVGSILQEGEYPGPTQLAVSDEEIRAQLCLPLIKFDGQTDWTFLCSGVTYQDLALTQPLCWCRYDIPVFVMLLRLYKY